MYNGKEQVKLATRQHGYGAPVDGDAELTGPVPLRRALAGEILGTYLLVLFGTGSVAAAVLAGAQVGLWQIAVVWGFGITLAIYASAALSGAHLNPAVSLAFALLRRDDFPARRLLPYITAQLTGGVMAGATIAGLFWPFLLRFEAAHGIARGMPGSELSAMVFGEYFPNPAMFGTDATARALVSPLRRATIRRPRRQISLPSSSASRLQRSSASSHPSPKPV